MPSDRFQSALDAIDAANAQDPNRTVVNSVPQPEELVYSQRMTAWLDRQAPDASEALRLAVRAQHLMRWKIPRSEFPMDREGYLRWRKRLGDFHADAAGEILRQAGYELATIQRVRALIRKERLKIDPEAQTLEDVACLVFLENYFHAFARDRDQQKLIHILRRTWSKMSERGRNAAMGLALSDEDRAIIEQALRPAGSPMPARHPGAESDH